MSEEKKEWGSRIMQHCKLESNGERKTAGNLVLFLLILIAQGTVAEANHVTLGGDRILSLKRTNPGALQATGFVVDAKTTGAWFDQSHNGEGWKIEIIDNTTAVVYWFTFPPPGVTSTGAGNGQSWMIGLGKIQGDRIVVDEVTITHGAIFGPDFNPADVVSEKWGDMAFTFTGPNEGTMTYNGPPEWGSGSFTISRLSGVHDLQVNAKSALIPDNVGSGISGSWFNPAHKGEGWVIEIIGAQTALIFWFTYDDQGNQAWNLGIGKLAGNKIYVKAPIEPKGTEFGSGFQASNVVNEDWGNYTFFFDSCGTGQLAYTSAKGLGLDSQPIQRLSSIDTVQCTPFDPDKPPDNTLATNPSDPLIMAVNGKDGLQSEFFGTKQADGTSTALTAARLKDAAENAITILMDAQNRPAVISANSGNHTEISYTDDPDEIYMKAVLANGKQSLARINLNELQPKFAVHPAARTPIRADHAHANVTQTPALEAEIAGLLNQSATSTSTVLVQRCGAPVDDATVTVDVTVGSNTLTFPAPRSGPGTYTADIPTTRDNTGGQSTAAQKCDAVASFAEDDCAFVRRMDDRDINAACQLAVLPLLDDDPSFGGGVYFFECLFSFAVMRDSCRETAPAAATTGQAICENVTEELDRSVDASTGTVTIQPTANIAGEGLFVVEAKNSSSQGPFPDFEFAFDSDAIVIASLYTEQPTSQGYLIEAQMECVPQSTTQINMFLTRSTGLSRNFACFTGGSSSNLCQWNAPPGGGAGVRDTIKVQVGADGPSRTIVVVF